MEAPLWSAIKLLDKAKRKKKPAHPKFKAMLELRVKEEARKVNEQLGSNAIATLEKIVNHPDWSK